MYVYFFYVQSSAESMDELSMTYLFIFINKKTPENAVGS